MEFTFTGFADNPFNVDVSQEIFVYYQDELIAQIGGGLLECEYEECEEEEEVEWEEPLIWEEVKDEEEEEYEEEEEWEEYEYGSPFEPTNWVINPDQKTFPVNSEYNVYLLQLEIVKVFVEKHMEYIKESRLV